MNVSARIRSALLAIATIIVMRNAMALPDFDALWDYDKPAATESQFRRILAETQASANESYTLELNTQIARTLGLQKRFDEAHAILDTVDAALAAPRAGDTSLATSEAGERPEGAQRDPRGAARVRALLERGRVFNSSGQRERSRPLFLAAWEQARSAGLDFYAVDAAHMMAIVVPADEQLAWNEKALAIADRSSDVRARNWAGSLYNNIGMTWLDRGEFEKALESFQKGLDQRLKKQPPDPKTIRIARWTVAHALRKLGRIDEALAKQRAIEAEIADAKAEPDGFVDEEIAECLLAKGEVVLARPYFRKAYERLSAIDWVKSDAARLERLERLARDPGPGQPG